MTAYEGQIKALDYKTREYAFLSVRATGNVDPYRFATKEAAQHMLDSCYPGLVSEDMKVIEVDAEPNIHIQGW
jgi:hypothetical protein